MDVGAHLLEALFVRDTKMLLFVDHEKAEVLEFDRLGQQSVRADYNINRAVGHPVACCVGILGRDKPAERAHLDRKATEPFGKGFEVLSRQKRRGCNHRNLYARHRGHKRCPHCDFGLAKAHVTADQSVHWIARRQIVDHFADRAQLIIRFGIRKTGAESVPHTRRRLQHRCLAQRALCGHADQLVSDFANALFQFGLFGLPRAAAQTVQQPLFVAVARQQLNVFDRQIQFCVVGIFQRQAFMRSTRRRDHFHAQISSDPVIDMNNQVTRRQRLCFGQEVFGAPFALGRADQTVAQNILFRNHCHLIGFEALIQTPDSQVQTAFPNPAGIGYRDRLGQAFIFDQAGQTLARALGVTGYQHRTLLQFDLNVVCQRTEKTDGFLLSLRRKIATYAATCIQNTQPCGLWQNGQLQHAPIRNERLPFGVGQIQPTRWRGLVDAVHLRAVGHGQSSGLILVFNAVPTCQTRRCYLIIQRNRRPRQVVKKRLKTIMEKGQPVFGPLMFAPGADGLIERIIGAGGTEFDPVVLAKPGDRGIVQYDFGDRSQFDHIQLFRCALRVGVKPPRAIQRIAEQIKPHWPQIARRININNTTAYGIIARFCHGRALHEPHPHQKAAQRGLVNPVSYTRGKCRIAQDGACRNTLCGGIQCCQKNEPIRHPMRQSSQRCHSLGRNIRIGRHPIIGQAIPGREHHDRQVRGKETQSLLHRSQSLVVARNMDQRYARALQFCDQKRCVKALRRAGHRDF